MTGLVPHLRRLVALTMVYMLASCGSDDAPGPVTDTAGTNAAPRGLAVSAPVRTPVPGGGEPGGATVAFVSAFPGTVVHAATARVVIDGEPVHAVLALDGGFDPVPVPARAGDQVRVVLTDSAGSTISVTAMVKSGARPRVVRTSPAPHRTDVPLNAIIRVVFSTPMSLESVRAGVRLTQAGARVAAEVEAGDANGVAYDLIPVEQLVPATDYAIEIAPTVEDVNGVPLSEAVTAPFTTTQVTGSVRVATTTTGVMIPTGYHVVLNGVGEWLPVGVNDTLLIPRLLEGDNLVRLEGVASNCTVEGGALRTVRVTTGGTTGVAFVVSCVAVGDVVQLTVTAVTSGADPDPDGYLVRVLGNFIADSAVASPNGSVTFVVLSEVPYQPNDYYLILERVAPNCIADPSSHEGIVGKSDITETFSINCAPVRQLAAVIDQGSGADIYLVNSNGTGATALTSSAALDDDPAWSADGSRLVFSSERDGDREIYVMDANGSSPVRITHSAGVDERPAWAPDGNRIAFVSKRDGNAEIYVMNPDGTGQTRLTNSPSEDTDPAWSPDGGRIAFASNRSGVPNIHVMDADGTSPEQLSFDVVGASSSQPSWAPDGSAIAYVQTVSSYGGYSSLVRMTSHGYPADPVGVVVTGSDRLADPAWSPDGRQIAVTRATCPFGSGCRYDVVVFPSARYGTFSMLRSNTRNPAWRP